MDSATQKRMILMESESTGIRKKMMENRDKEGGLTSDEIVDIGNALESMTKTKGWAHIDYYLTKHIDSLNTQLVNEDGAGLTLKGAIRSLKGVMHYVEQMIAAKNEILTRENAKRNVQPEES